MATIELDDNELQFLMQAAEEQFDRLIEKMIRATLKVKDSQFYLTPSQVKAIKDAGFWDDPIKRASLIASYVRYERELREAQEAKKAVASMPEEFKEPEPSPLPEEPSPLVEEKPKKAVKRRKSKAAPWGYKKDGTPRGRPGRKPKENA